VGGNLIFCKLIFWRERIKPLIDISISRYVDEVQDNLLIDGLCKLIGPVDLGTLHVVLNSNVSVLRYICGNPNGLFWAGDTAQTISVGSSFRFKDHKAFLHRMEVIISVMIVIVC
jgi:hypothetical protein